MTVLKTKDIINHLSGKGFVIKEGNHTFLTLYVDGKKTSIYTCVSHGGKEIGDGLISAMASQVRLEKRQFIDLVECPLDQKTYITELIKNGDLEL